MKNLIVIFFCGVGLTIGNYIWAAYDGLWEKGAEHSLFQIFALLAVAVSLFVRDALTALERNDVEKSGGSQS